MNAEQVFSIGTVNAVRQPLTVGKKVHELPEKSYWAWDPGGYIGLCQPDTFWISRDGRPAAVQSLSAVRLSLDQATDNTARPVGASVIGREATTRPTTSS